MQNLELSFPGHNPNNLGIVRKFLRFLKLFTISEIFYLVAFC